MADQLDDELPEPTKRAIRKYLVRLALAGVALLGSLNVVSLVTFVPNLAVTRVAEGEPLKDLRERMLVGVGSVTESVRRAQQDLAEIERSLNELDDKIDALRKTDTRTLIERAVALNSLGEDSKKVLDAVAALRAEIPTRVILREGSDAFWYSDPFANESERDCPSGFVQIGTHFGKNNRDMRIRCRHIVLGQ